MLAEKRFIQRIVNQGAGVRIHLQLRPSKIYFICEFSVEVQFCIIQCLNLQIWCFKYRYTRLFFVENFGSLFTVWYIFLGIFYLLMFGIQKFEKYFTYRYEVRNFVFLVLLKIWYVKCWTNLTTTCLKFVLLQPMGKNQCITVIVRNSTTQRNDYCSINHQLSLILEIIESALCVAVRQGMNLVPIASSV